MAFTYLGDVVQRCRQNEIGDLSCCASCLVRIIVFLNHIFQQLILWFFYVAHENTQLILRIIDTTRFVLPHALSPTHKVRLHAWGPNGDLFFHGNSTMPTFLQMSSRFKISILLKSVRRWWEHSLLKWEITFERRDAPFYQIAAYENYENFKIFRKISKKIVIFRNFSKHKCRVWYYRVWKWRLRIIMMWVSHATIYSVCTTKPYLTAHETHHRLWTMGISWDFSRFYEIFEENKNISLYNILLSSSSSSHSHTPPRTLTRTHTNIHTTWRPPKSQKTKLICTKTCPKWRGSAQQPVGGTAR